jgi:hypothetical protein
MPWTRARSERHRRPPLAPRLRINRILRAMLTMRWSAEAWSQVKAEFKKALALKSQIRRAGWFN